MFKNISLDNMVGAYHLRRLFIFRVAVIVSELAVTLLAIYEFGVELPMAAMLSVIAIYSAFNVLVWLRLKGKRTASNNEFFLHLVIDVLALAVLLYFAGGSGNPFVSMFLLPLVIVASTLPKRYVWIMAAVTMACYTLLMLINLPHSMAMTSHHHGTAAHDFDLHMLGMWFSFLLGVGVILFFVVSMAEALRQRDRRLSEIREKALRDEHIVALGTLAAGAAHELSTPLATMALLTGEMAEEYRHLPELGKPLSILKSQIDRCKEALSRINASVGQMRAEGGRSVALDAYLRDVVNQWRQLHDDAQLTESWQGSMPAPAIVADETLTQSIINVLTNAVEVSPQHVEISGEWSDEHLRLTVNDSGPGFSAAALESAASPFFTTKPQGQGLGMFLTRAVMQRLGGDVLFDNRPEGGASVTLTLPLAKLKATV